MADMVAELLKLERQRVRLLSVANKLTLDVGKHLPENATLEDIIKRLETIDSYSLLNNYVSGKNYIINDTDGSIKNIIPYAFYNDTGLTGIDDMAGIETISTNLAFHKSALQYARFSNLTSITGEGTFSGCTSLKWVSFPSLSTLKPVSLFYDNSALECVTFNKNGKTSMTSGGSNFLRNTTNLKAFVFPYKGEISIVDPYAAGSTTFNAIKDHASVNIYVPRSLVEAYLSDGTWASLTDAALTHPLEIRVIEDYYDDLIAIGADLDDYVLEV